MKKFSGVITALVTPFIKGEVDYTSLKKLVEFQLKNGIDGFVINGTTGESPTLLNDEKKKIFQFVREIVGRQVPLILGTGSNSTKCTILASQQGEEWGADALLAVVPYYNKPPQRGLIEHFRQVANSVNLPVLLYNVPGRTVVSLSVDSVTELEKEKNIVGIKEASGNIKVAEEIRARCGSEFLLLSGDDGTYVPFLQAGGDGVISVVSHIIPAKMKEWQSQTLSSASEVIDSFGKYEKLMKLMGIEPNPIPVKMSLYLMGIIASPELRLPLVTLQDEHKETMKIEMQRLGII